jgi:hypothetical protein
MLPGLLVVMDPYSGVVSSGKGEQAGRILRRMPQRHDLNPDLMIAEVPPALPGG